MLPNIVDYQLSNHLNEIESLEAFNDMQEKLSVVIKDKLSKDDVVVIGSETFSLDDVITEIVESESIKDIVLSVLKSNSQDKFNQLVFKEIDSLSLALAEKKITHDLSDTI